MNPYEPQTWENLVESSERGGWARTGGLGVDVGAVDVVGEQGGHSHKLGRASGGDGHEEHGHDQDGARLAHQEDGRGGGHQTCSTRQRPTSDKRHNRNASSRHQRKKKGSQQVNLTVVLLKAVLKMLIGSAERFPGGDFGGAQPSAKSGPSSVAKLGARDKSRCLSRTTSQNRCSEEGMQRTRSGLVKGDGEVEGKGGEAHGGGEGEGDAEPHEAAHEVAGVRS